MSESERTIYISGPMTGFPAFNFPAFIDATNNLRAAGYKVVSPHEFGEGEAGKSWSDYLRQDLIALLTHCDSVAVLDHWRGSKGATLEVSVARALDMQVQTVGQWIEAVA